MKKPLLLGLLALFLMPPLSACSKNNYAEAAYERKDVAALTRMAEAGEPIAQYNLGNMYRKGEAIAENPEIAVNWYHKAADQGYAEAQVNLGIMYYSGSGVTKDRLTAATWWSKAADQGNAMAMMKMGLIYYTGEVVEKNYVLSYKWFTISEKLGYRPARWARGDLATKMTKTQISEANLLVEQWRAKN